MTQKTVHPQTLEEVFAREWANPPAPFNPEAIHETSDELLARYAHDDAYGATLPVHLTEDEKRLLRADSRRVYWENYVATKRQEAGVTWTR